MARWLFCKTGLGDKMIPSFLPALVSLLGLCISVSSAEAAKLVLMGGGTRPPAAITQFVQWAGGKGARYLVIPWGQGDPASIQKLKTELAAYSPADLQLAPLPPFSETQKKALIGAITESTGIFFTGGDQNKIMAVFADPSILSAFRARVQSGEIVVGGTSAGTAIQSKRMLNGLGNEQVIDPAAEATSPGLGLLPEGVIVDQHFIKRSRWNRLMGQVLGSSNLVGIGIDEDMAITIDDSLLVRVYGGSQVARIAQCRESGEIRIQLFSEGQSFGL